MDREYEIEHFGFTAEQSILERKHFLQKIIGNALDAIVNKFEVNEKTFEVLCSAKKDVFENIWMSMKNEVDSLNNLDKKYFTIPDYVLIPPYFDHVKSYTEEDEQELDKQLDMLKKTFLQNSVMLASLNMENSQYKSLSTFTDNEVKIQDQVQESFNSINLDTINKLVDKTNII